MQLSVFLTPIFAQQISVGFGVCEELAVFSAFKKTSTHSLSSHSSSNAPSRDDDMSGMSMAEMPHLMAMQNPHSAHSTIHVSKLSQQYISHQATTSTVFASKFLKPILLQTQVEPQHQHHAKCEFCLLLGHSVLPPLHVVIAVLLTIIITKMMVKAKTADVIFLNQNKNLRPQGRAPPHLIS